MKTLIIVDPQYDFIEGGTLPVKGGQQALDNVVEYLKSNKEEIDGVIITVDWHHYNHCSFKENGGEWPTHCVQYTKGASIYMPLINCLQYNKIYYRVISKGFHKTEENYSAFTDCCQCTMMGKSFWELESVNEFSPLIPTENEIVICGLAGDVCVLNTMKAIKECSPTLLKSGVACINEQTLDEFINENNIKWI